MTSLSALALPTLALVLAAALPTDEPLKDIKSKEPEVREAAARLLAEDDSPKAVGALLKAASRDEDVLVVLAALGALDGREASDKIVSVLVDLALESPFTRIRRTASEALGRMDAPGAREKLVKKSSGKTLAVAARALAWSMGAAEVDASRETKDVEKELKKLAKGLKSKAADERPIAARAMVALARGNTEVRATTLRSLTVERLDDEAEAAVICAALEEATSSPDPADLDVLAELLDTAALMSVVERRTERALAASLGLRDASEQAAFFDEKRGGEAASPRLARTATQSGIDRTVGRDAVVALLEERDEHARAAAVRALRRFGDDGVEAAIERIGDEASARVQLQFVQLLAEHGDIAGEEEGEPKPAARALIAALEEGVSDLVKEAAAVALGRPDAPDAAVRALSVAAAKSDARSLGTVAAIALGRTRSDNALGPLTSLSKTDEWTARAAAAEGLKQLSRADCVEPLLTLVQDGDAAVQATAHRALLRFSNREGDDVDPATWPEWWAENGKRARYRTKEEKRELAEKYGYGVDDSVIYRGLDVIVVPGRGDRIEGVLERLGIKFRIARAGQLDEAGLHPEAILLVGCTGELGVDDVDIVQWYVRAGGALFTSCWALTYTVEPAFPAILTKFPSPGEVVDNVFALPTATAEESPYLRGVFDGGVQPYYSLLGAHLIEVLDPERATVLLDSPSAAARHGTGDLAAWFRAGHGVVLDTANHFEEQGFSAAKGLDKPVDRQAFAVNHMGLTLEELRRVAEEKWWKSTSKASGEVSDLSVFRILTNFVREKRING
ncbi:MAG: HEAT repeat domain-containing protein [Planctomycetota bacterium]